MATTEADQRAVVIAEARTWIGTKYHACADIKGVGVDCGMLLIRCFVDTGLAPPFDPRPYPADWHLHRDEEKYLGFVLAHMGEVAKPQPGDVTVFRIGRCYSHGGIVTGINPLRLVHAYHDEGGVFEVEVWRDKRLSDPERKPRHFSLWAK